MANTRSLLWQPSLLDAGEESRFDAQFASVRRVELDETAWVEHVSGWVHGADALFATIVERAPWTQRRVHMYDRMVDEPRLIAWYGVALDDVSLPPVIAPMAAALSARYGREFDGVGAALYRDGRDSVAWHADRIPAEIVEPVVALISLGSPRTLRMRRRKATAERPEGSGARNRPMDMATGRARQRDARSFTFVPGDLFVMGGMSQRTWEHSVPKVASAGPRLSLQFRHSC
jgi:alkylated DNA repair dioxygenase AlkB